jgi:serine/threonine protein phosphatase 1
MRQILDRLAPGRRRAEDPVFDAPLAPAEPLAVIGDVHGCDGLLARILTDLEAHAPQHRVVVVGDVIDRGEDSAGVLRRLQARPGTLCLRGNHEDMLLRFLREPERAGRGWLSNGGLQTLASFGVGGLGLGADGRALRDAAMRLRAAMGEELLAWMQVWPLSFRSGNVLVVHAGADPRREPDDQDEQVLLWGHPRFESELRTDGVWVVHGHVIRPAPEVEAGRIAVDTGAFATGHLTAALIAPGQGEFVLT